MLTKYITLATALTVALTLPLFAQHSHGDTTKTGMTMHDMSSMMGAPTIDATVEGLHLKVWLMTQNEHKEMMKGKMGQMMTHGDEKGHMHMMGKKDTSMGMGKDMMGIKHEGMGMKDTSMAMGNDMKGMKHDGMKLDKATKEAMMSGTHHIMLDPTDVASGKEITGASAKVMIVSPSRKNSSIDLKPMMSHFGNGLTLDEKGTYQLTVSVNINGISKTKQFQYFVK